MKWFALILILCLTVSVDANPDLTARPVETPDYYVVSINGEAETVSPAPPDDVLKYDLESLPYGLHSVEIISAGFSEGEGPPITFQIKKTIEGEWTVYEIEPLYDNVRFTTPLKISVQTINQDPPDDDDKGGSGCSG